MVAVVGVVVAAVAWRSLRRVEVVGGSMAPALLPGDRLVVLGPPWPGAPRLAWPRPGQVVAVRDPGRTGRILIKRVTEVNRIQRTIHIEGDAGHASTDSRTFGPVPHSSLVGWAVYRYAPTGRSGPAPWPDEYHLA